jgi:hypothetical protein
MAPRGTGFTSIGDYLAANQGTLAGERGALTGKVSGELDDAKSAADKVVAGIQHGTDPTAAAGYGDALLKQKDAEADATLLGGQGGIQDLLQRQYNDSQEQGKFDATLLAGAPGFGDVQAKAKGLGDYLDAQAFPAAAALPTTPAAAPEDPGSQPAAPPGDVATPPQTGIPEKGGQPQPRPPPRNPPVWQPRRPGYSSGGGER